MTLPLLLVLTACQVGEGQPEQAAARLQEVYRASPTVTAEGEVTADYGDRAYQYTVSWSGTAREGSLTVTAPENIAGAGAVWQEGKTALAYEGLTLETGPLSPDGLSPADALPTILSLCAQGVLLESGWEGGEETSTIYLRLQNPAAQESQLALWADPSSGALRQAELCWQEQPVITLVFHTFTIETNPISPE